MSQMPLISVVVPVYNAKAFLGRCIDSILAQTFTDFDLILVNDGSKDQSGEICEQYALKDNRIHVIHNKNRGAAAARNLGIAWSFENSDSQWFAYIDSDDWVHPQYLEFLLKAAEETNTKIAVSEFERVSEYTVPETPKQLEYTVQNAEDFWCRDYLTATIVCAKLYAKDLFQDVRYPEGIVHEDEFVTYRLLFETEQSVLIHEPLYYYYYNENSVMLKKWTPARLVALDASLNQAEYFRIHGFERAYRYQCGKFVRLCARSLDRIDMYVEDPVKKKDLKKKWLAVLRQFVKDNRAQLSFRSSPRGMLFAIPACYSLFSSLRKLPDIIKKSTHKQ